MKILLSGFLLGIIIVSPSSAWSEAVIEPQEYAAPEVDVCCDEDTYKLTVSVRGGPIYELSGAPYSTSNLRAFENMSDRKREEFIHLRSLFIGKAAAILHHTRLIWGTGSLIKNKIRQLFVRSKSSPEHPIEAIAKDIAYAEDLTGSANSAESATSFGDRIRSRGHQIVHNILKGIDHKLWREAPLVADHNELFLTISLGAVAISGAGPLSKGGSFGLGLSFHYNKTTQTFYFDIFSENEKINYSITPTLMIGISPKVGFGVARQDSDDLSYELEGHSFYPPGAPGYATSLNHFAAVGVNSALLTFPSVLGDAMSYVNTSRRRTLFRFSLSPKTKGFIRVRLMPKNKKVTPCAEHFKNTG